MSDEKLHKEAVLVTDKILAVALFAAEHPALLMYENEAGSFYCAFAITARLRKDLRLYYGIGLNVDARKLNEELDDTNIYLADYACYIHAKLSDSYAKSESK